MAQWTVVVVDDHPLFRSAVRGVVEQLGEVRILEGSSLDDCHAHLENESQVDLVLLDLNMSDSFGLYGLVSIRKTFPEVPVAIVSATEEPVLIQKAIRLGALGYVPKSSAPRDILAGIKAVLDGELWLPASVRDRNLDQEEDVELGQRLASLTPQQYRILGYLREGLLNKEIADDLCISEATVKAHLSAVFKKLRVNNRTQAVVMASEFFLDEQQAAASKPPGS